MNGKEQDAHKAGASCWPEVATCPSLIELSMQVALTLLLCCAVIDGMDIVKRVEAIGSGDGKPSKTVHIADSGEITGAASAAA